jgi:glycosyltransferase 2 family protein
VRVTDTARHLREEDAGDWQRHPVDVARLAMRLSLLGLILLVTATTPTALQNVSADLVRLFARSPVPVRYALVGTAQITILVIPILIVWGLAQRRATRAIGLVVGAAVTGGIVMLLLMDWLDRTAPPAAITDLPSNSFVATDFPSVAYLAALVAGATAASPMISARWRRFAWLAVGVAATVRVLSATQTPVNVAVTLALGSAVGSAALVAFGSPRRRPGSGSLRAWLADGGVTVDQLRDESSEHGLRRYQGSVDGRVVDVVYLDRDDRDVELFARIVRSVRVRDVDEQRLSVQPRIRATQWATATMMAERAGATVPEVRAVVPADTDRAVIVFEATPGVPLAELDGDGVSDDALVAIWRELGTLHEHRIAHRSLSPSNVMVDGSRARLTGLDAALLASSDASRAVDRAELLVSTALVVGPERALDASVRVVPADDLEATLPYMQIPALPASARKDVKRRKQLVDELRVGLQERLGVEAVELAELERISVPKVVSWVGFAILALFLLTLVTNLSDIRDAMSGINWAWVVPAVVVTLLGTVAGAMSLSGSVVRPIALGEATVVMFGQSFLNRFTPMNAGGMAMRIRYLQKGGTDATVATAAIGLTSAASGVVQVLFIAFFFLWTSTDPTGGLSPSADGLDVSIVGVFVGAIAVAAVVLVLAPRLRRWILGFLRSTYAKIRSDFGELAQRPSKMGLLFGGQALAKLSTIICWYAACMAFDVDLSFAELGALYMLANTVASTVPTPGGVGAIEAALVFVLTSAGVDEATAWASMLLFRLVNYWFPTIPGYVGLKISERRRLI